jgi:hypothetical protein
MYSVNVKSKQNNHSNHKLFSEKLDDLKDFIKDRHTLKVGWFDSAIFSNGEKIGNVAFWQEYGTKNIPPRPFVRPAKKINIKTWKKTICADIKKEIKKGNSDFLPIFDKLGFKVAGDIKRAIEAVYSPRLAESTIRGRMKRRGISKEDRKKLSPEQTRILEKPLIDTGKMISTVDFHSSKG